MKFIRPLLTANAALLLAAVTLIADPFEISWNSLDGGGACGSTAAVGGSFELSGTVGQPDASSFGAPLSGGSYEIVGGFWTFAASICACPGDMNLDGLKDGGDIQQFVTCLISGGSCSCADVDEVPGLSEDDIIAFIDDLLADSTCP